jgi:hypothetical protein
MREIILITFGCASTISLLCMALFAFQACWKSDWLAAVLEKEWQYLSLILKNYFYLAAIGFLVCVYQGTHALLWWMPSNWGSNDEDGDFTSVRVFLSWAALFSLGIPLSGLILRGITETARAKRLETRLHAAETSAAELSKQSKQLETHKAIIESLREQIESLRSKSDR